jgi:hypothetical protein
MNVKIVALSSNFVGLSRSEGQSARPAAGGGASTGRLALSTLQGGIDFVMILHEAINRKISGPGLRSCPPLAQGFLLA